MGKIILLEGSKLFLKCKNARVSECGRSEPSGKGCKRSAGLQRGDGYRAESEKWSCVE